jgi:hypothetical protein
MKVRTSAAVHSPALTATLVVTRGAKEMCAAELTFKAVVGAGGRQLGKAGSLPLAGSSGTRVALSNELS